MRIIFLSIILLFLPTALLKADTWTDPTWEEMINKSNFIAYVEVVEGGVFKAKVRPYKIFKGRVNSDEIWITGFSNKYGPFDTLKVGQKYCVFLFETKRYRSRFNSMSGFADTTIMNLARKSYIEVINDKNGYLVWTPTSGELLIENDSIHYDLLTTSYSNYYSLKPLNEFSEFLINSMKRFVPKLYYETLVEKANTSLLQPQKMLTHQYIMMLHLAGNRKFYDEFNIFVNDTVLVTRFALAKHLGDIKDNRARDLLVKMLNDNNSVVQGEVVRQLSTEKAHYIGPILLSYLENSGEKGLYPSSLMDPVRNQLDGGKMGIIKVLGELKYKPAAEKLLPLLETDNQYLFRQTLRAIKKLECHGYIPYVISHIEKGTSSFFLDLCRIVTDEKIEEGKTALMNYIRTNKTDRLDYEFAVSYLGYYDDEETKEFLLNEFNKLLSANDTTKTDFKNSWIKEYIETFESLKYKEARFSIYNALFYWCGFNVDFAEYLELFEIKHHLEDSIVNKAKSILKEYNINNIQSIVFIQNTGKVVKGEKPETSFIIHVSIKYEEQATDSTENQSNFLSGSDKIFDLIHEVQTKLKEKLGETVKISANSGMYYSRMDDRFEKRLYKSPMSNFFKYVIKLPNPKDIEFLKGLLKSGYIENEYDKEKLIKTISEIEMKIEK